MIFIIIEEMEACSCEVNKDLIKLNKIAKNNYMDYNSLELPKIKPWVPGHHIEVMKLNLCFEQNNHNYSKENAQSWLNIKKKLMINL